MRSIPLIFVGLIACLLIDQCCCAATISELNLVTDGSATPPGDRIDFVIQFSPDESEIEIMVRGFLVSGEQNEVVTPLGSNSQNGVLGRKVVARDAVSHLQRGSIVVPYVDLALPQGTHRIAYELMGTVKGKPAFTRPTALTQVVITQETRHQIDVNKTTFSDRLESRSQQVRVAGPRMRGRPQQIISKETMMQAPVVESITESQTVPVEIPGEFRRSEVPDVGPVAHAAKSGIEETDSQSLSGQTWQPLSDLESDQERRIWFATNRAAVDGNAKRFNAILSPKVQYGSCVVSIPIQTHRKGTLEQPSWWTRRDPTKHFLIKDTQVFDKAAFQEQLGQGDVLLFVHGFYNTFEDAIYRTSQLHHDLDFAGQSLAFSWPSAGDITKYDRDQSRADASVDALVDVIRTVGASLRKSDTTQAKIHIIAHSMGNRVLLQSLYKIIDSTSDENQLPPLGQVVLAAPDVGAIMFNNLSPYAVDLSEQVTYYYCQSDAALSTSRSLNRYEPVGLLPYFNRGLSTINANGVGTSFIGHGYYASSREVLRDVELMIKYGTAPAQRMPPLAHETKVFGHKCWSFVETKKATEASVSP